MSIVSVDNIQPIGSGTTVTVNKSVTLESGNTNITGVCTATSFSGSGANLTGVLSNIVEDTSPQLGGNLDTNSFEINLDDSHAVRFGNSNDLQIFHASNGVSKIEDSGAGFHIRQINNGDIHIHAGTNTGTSNNRLVARAAGSAELHYSGNKKLETTNTGATITGNLAFASGNGIDFSAQTASSATGTTVTSELLDHYEEGTWLPDIRGSSTAGTATYTSRSGRYVRIGRIVHVYTDVRWSAHTGAGGLEVHGLPFPQTGGYWGHFGINYNAGHSWTSGRQIYGWANIGGDFIRYWQTDSNGGSGNLPLDSVVGEIHFYGHYLTST